jgi:hypothetical protein
MLGNTLRFHRDGVLRVRHGIRNRATGEIMRILVPAIASASNDHLWILGHLDALVELEDDISIRELVANLEPFRHVLWRMAPTFPGPLDMAPPMPDGADALQDLAGILLRHELTVRQDCDMDGPLTKRIPGTWTYEVCRPTATGDKWLSVDGWQAYTISQEYGEEQLGGIPFGILADLPVRLETATVIREESSEPGEASIRRNVRAPLPTLKDTIIDGLISRMNWSFAEMTDEGPRPLSQGELKESLADSIRNHDQHAMESAAAAAAGPEAVDALERRIQQEIADEQKATLIRHAAEPFSRRDLELLAHVKYLDPEIAALVLFPDGRPPGTAN